MGVPPTRPLVITQHANRKELIDRRNLWNGQIMVPGSAQAMLEYRLDEAGHRLELDGHLGLLGDCPFIGHSRDGRPVRGETP